MTQEEQAQRFYAYVWPHRAVVLRTARFLSRNAAEAEDLAQETLMRAFRKIDQLDVADNPAGWLTSILRNVRIDQTRRRGEALLTKAQSLEADTVEAHSFSVPHKPNTTEEILETLSDQALIDALHELPEEIRWTILLVDIQEMAYDEAAEVLDVPAGTIKSRVYRGRQMLREALLGPQETRSGHEAGRRR